MNFIPKFARALFGLGLILIIHSFRVEGEFGSFAGGIGGLLLGIGSFLNWGEDY